MRSTRTTVPKWTLRVDARGESSRPREHGTGKVALFSFKRQTCATVDRRAPFKFTPPRLNFRLDRRFQTRTRARRSSTPSRRNSLASSRATASTVAGAGRGASRRHGTTRAFPVRPQRGVLGGTVRRVASPLDSSRDLPRGALAFAHRSSSRRRSPSARCRAVADLVVLPPPSRTNPAGCDLKTLWNLLAKEWGDGDSLSETFKRGLWTRIVDHATHEELRILRGPVAADARGAAKATVDEEEVAEREMLEKLAMKPTDAALKCASDRLRVARLPSVVASRARSNHVSREFTPRIQLTTPGLTIPSLSPSSSSSSSSSGRTSPRRRRTST